MDGLENVVVADTALSDVDGVNGRLVIKGFSLDELAGRMSFEATAALLWADLFEDLPDTEEFASRLGQARAEVFAGVDALRGDLLDRPPIEAMRALVAHLADGEDLRTAFRLLAAPAVFAPAVICVRQGLAPIAPDPALAQSADILRMLSGTAPSSAQAAALDVYLVTVIDHGLNASTFAARVTASTRAGLTSAALAGLSALKGPLHGGAPGPVAEMLDEIGAPDRAQAWLEAALARGERLMGFGHRIYRVRDPRADARKSVV